MKVTLSAVVLLLIAVVASSKSTTQHVGCRDESGNPVDWWVMSKQPMLTTQPLGSRFKAGLGYAYGDVNDATLVISSNWLNGTTALSHTLEQIYTPNPATASQLVWMMYNDQPPEDTDSTDDKNTHHDMYQEEDGELDWELFEQRQSVSSVSSDYAHSKGVVAFDNGQGFWLIHSTPRFPLDPVTDKYEFPENEIRNGQSYLCVTYGSNTFDTIMQQLYINRPYVYTYSVGAESTLPQNTLKSILDGGYQEEATGQMTSMTSVGGVQFSVFAKNKQWNSDLYEELVQQSLKQGMIVTSWRLGANSTIMQSFCEPKYKYDSINSMQLSISTNANGGDDTLVWSYTKDHSKWAVSLPDEPTQYICISDINRMYSQYKRGGGCACFVNDSLWKSYFNTVTNTATCPINN